MWQYVVYLRFTLACISHSVLGRTPPVLTGLSQCWGLLAVMLVLDERKRSGAAAPCRSSVSPLILLF